MSERSYHDATSRQSAYGSHLWSQNEHEMVVVNNLSMKLQHILSVFSIDSVGTDSLFQEETDPVCKWRAMFRDLSCADTSNTFLMSTDTSTRETHRLISSSSSSSSFFLSSFFFFFFFLFFFFFFWEGGC